MALFFEHESIRRALISSGAWESSNKAPQGLTRPVFVAWSNSRTLLLRPSYAWLSLAEVAFIRLPQPYSQLKAAIEEASQSHDESSTLRSLKAPLGQFLWAIAEVQQNLTGECENVERALELRRFAKKYWPGWYERVLGELLTACKEGSDTVAKLAMLGKHATGVAVFEAVRPLTAWIEEESRSEDLATFEDLIAYLCQGVLDDQSVRDLGFKLDWLQRLDADFVAAEKALNLIRQAGEEPESIIGRYMESISQALFDLRHLGTDVPSTATSLPIRAALDILIAALAGILKLRMAHRASLSG